MRTSKIIPIQSAKVHRKLNISLLILCYQVKILNDLSCTPTSSKSYNHTLLKLMHPSLCSGPLGFVCIITMWRQLNLILITVMLYVIPRLVLFIKHSNHCYNKFSFIIVVIYVLIWSSDCHHLPWLEIGIQSPSAFSTHQYFILF